MNRPIKCERTNCYRDPVYIAEERHPQRDGSVDVEHRATCEIHGKSQLPQNLTLLSAWRIIQWPDRRCDA
jgi:hypothetical protein